MWTEISWEEKFASSCQPDLKLDIALDRLLQQKELSPKWKQTYREYLSRRSYSALGRLISQGDPEKLRKFLGWNLTDGDQCKRALSEFSVENPEMRLLLMGMDGEVSGAAAFTVEDAACQAWKLMEESLAAEIPYLHLFFADFHLAKAPVHLLTGTDGLRIFLQPQQIIDCYRDRSLRELYEHIMVHVLYGHVLPNREYPRELWDISCDISAWKLKEKIFGLSPEEKGGSHRTGALTQLFPSELELEDAVSVCKYLQKGKKTREEAARLLEAFPKDEHEYWYSGDSSSRAFAFDGEEGSGSGQRTGETKKERYLEKLSEKLHRVREELSVRSLSQRKGFGPTPGSRQELLKLRKEGQYDFRRYLRRFASVGEELQTDEESFDYAWYLQGLARYGNMPLIEPLEYMDACRVEELVIAIDTSSSCSLNVVRRFLEETRKLLTQQENFFSRMNVHIIQCDSMIQQHRVISCTEDWQRYERELTVEGRGGTDFTPVFSFVEKLREQGALKKLRGLLYFTDGKGIYPRRPTDYETVFVFTRREFLEEEEARVIPDWAVKVCLDISEEG